MTTRKESVLSSHNQAKKTSLPSAGPRQRPGTPRSSLLPPAEPNWPNSATPSIKSGENSWGISPALQGLLKLKPLPRAQPVLLAFPKRKVSSSLLAESEIVKDLDLPPFSRLILPISVYTNATMSKPTDLTATWVNDVASDSPTKISQSAILSTRLMRRVKSKDWKTKWNLPPPHLASKLASRPQLFPNSSAPRPEVAPWTWLTTQGTTVRPTANGWQISVFDLPAASLRPAELELSLPPDFEFTSNDALWFSYHLETEDPDRHEEFELNFRTNRGNLYSVWPRQFARRTSQLYFELQENFTPMFFARSQAPLDINSERIVAINIRIRPRSLPTILHFHSPVVVQRIEFLRSP